MKQILVSFLILTTGAWTMAQSASLRTVVASAKPARTEAKKDWNLSAAFSSGTDMNKPPEKRRVQHSFSTSFGYDLRKDLSTNIGTGFEMIAEGSNIRNEEGNPAWDDINVDLDWRTSIFSNSSFRASVSESLPTGSESRAEQVKSVLVGEVGLSTPFFRKRLNLTNSLNVARLFQTFDYSPNTLESNPDTVTSGALGLSYSITSYIMIGATASAKSVHYINGENVLRTSTSEFISYAYRNWKLKLSYTLGHYDKNDSYKFLYLDDARQLVKLGVQVEI
ncbi:MAG: hypothetical protein ACXWC9_01800 [Pseudobdellovibrionaceae bacterium]